MADAFAVLIEDLHEEHEALDAVVAVLDDAAWDVPTPASGWRVRDQIGHLAFFDQRAQMAITDTEAFVAERDAALEDFGSFSEEAGRLGREHTGLLLLSAWRTARALSLDAMSGVPESTRIPWYGPPMSPRSFVTARVMETWAHGQDVVDALHASRPATDRLRHIAFLGYSTRGWSYVVRGREAPSTPVRVELALPSGAAWAAGDESAPDRVSGAAEDFCLVVTQRRNVADTGLEVEGALAEEWMSIAQCFAGGPTTGPDAEG
ncbi:MAG: hypothetical protein QOJ67_2786 [Acidimicrobiaceae bacterium]|jgi:uncharacterized protein (TIGR03084 family)